MIKTMASGLDARVEIKLFASACSSLWQTYDQRIEGIM
jgi:hypothetical protein